jgi:hypothetical protein
MPETVVVSGTVGLVPDPHLLPRDLIEMLRAERRQVVPLIGAGLSVEARVPAADPLARILAEKRTERGAVAEDEAFLNRLRGVLAPHTVLYLGYRFPPEDDYLPGELRWLARSLIGTGTHASSPPGA